MGAALTMASHIVWFRHEIMLSKVITASQLSSPETKATQRDFIVEILGYEVTQPTLFMREKQGSLGAWAIYSTYISR